jgi:monoterpene epsilon-lactone hydrolase
LLQEEDMQSWQGYILRFYMRLNRFLTNRSGTLDVEKDRHNLEEMAKLFKPLAPVECRPVIVNNIPAEWIAPPGLSTQRVILYLHGGSFNAGSVASHRSLAANLATACKARVLIIDYRLAPEHPFPCAQEDALEAYEWLLSSGIPAEKIIVAGDSAGGTLTLTLLVQLRDQSKPLPALAVCLSPATDLTMAGESWTSNRSKDVMLDPRNIRTSIEVYLRDADPLSPLASPLYAELHGLPPLLIQVGSDECLLSDCTRFAEQAKQAGVPVTLEVWDGMQHVWQFAASLLPEGRQAIDHIAKYIDSILINPAPVQLETDVRV